ncbi:MAG: DUF5330 domain-containing protein [Pseudolabrys sp.]|nr:DUF5330 domain-containing protein [Pseudolabrys sp.]
MFFLLRMTFWLGLVCVLLPGNATPSHSEVDTAGAVSAATAAVSDMAGFCGRQPDACVVGGKVAVAIGQKAEAGARTIYEMISAKVAEKSGADKPSPAGARGTLSPTDLAPAWHAPIPLPPRREARVGRPSA